MATAIRRVGVMAIPNQCSFCGRFKSWDDLTTHFVPDSAFSSEDDSTRECSACRDRREAKRKVRQ